MIKQAGELDRRITIQSFTTSTDSFGEVNKSFNTLVNVWAKVEEKNGKEGEESEQIIATKRVEFFIRYRSDINDRIEKKDLRLVRYASRPAIFSGRTP